MFAAGFAEHGGKAGGAGRGFDSLPRRHLLRCVEEPEINPLLSRGPRFWKIPAWRNAAIVRANWSIV